MNSFVFVLVIGYIGYVWGKLLNDYEMQTVCGVKKINMYYRQTKY